MIYIDIEMDFELFQTSWGIGLPTYKVKTNNDKNIVKKIDDKKIDDNKYEFMHIFQHYYFHNILLNFVNLHYY